MNPDDLFNELFRGSGFNVFSDFFGGGFSSATSQVDSECMGFVVLIVFVFMHLLVHVACLFVCLFFVCLYVYS